MFFSVSDFLSELLKSRKKKTDAFKAGKSKATFNTFDLSDDEDKHNKTKKVSFLKTQRNNSPSNDTIASGPHENGATGSFVARLATDDGSFSSQHSTNVSEENMQLKNTGVESFDSRVTKENSSLSYQTSDDTLPLPLPSDSSVVDTPGPGEKTSSSVVEENSQTPELSASHQNHTVSAGLFSLVHDTSM